MDLGFWLDFAARVLIGAAGFAIAVASWRTSSGAARVSRKAEERQRLDAERAARHEAALVLIRFLEEEERNVQAVVDARFSMAKHGLDGFTGVVGWAIDQIHGETTFRSFVLVLIQNRLIDWVLTGELNREPLMTTLAPG